MDVPSKANATPMAEVGATHIGTHRVGRASALTQFATGCLAMPGVEPGFWLAIERSDV
jgi:hypothetical protein